jgi:hypothetical protein
MIGLSTPMSLYSDNCYTNHIPEGSNTLAHLSQIPPRPRPHAARPQHPVRPIPIPKGTSIRPIRQIIHPRVPLQRLPSSILSDKISRRNLERAVAFAFFLFARTSCRTRSLPTDFLWHLQRVIIVATTNYPAPASPSLSLSPQLIMATLRTPRVRPCVRSPALAEKNTAPANGRARATHSYPTHERKICLQSNWCATTSAATTTTLYAEKLHCS